jgi:Ca2+-binding RTX toxin-like protein
VNKIFGGEGDNDIDGTAANDMIYGRGGEDDLSGGDGNDTYYIDDAADVVVELSNGGIDTAVSSLKGYTLRPNVERLTLAEIIGGDNNLNGNGNALDNRIKGNSGNNELQGLGGNDEVYGFAGNDIINGGSGNDILDGGDGVDTISFKVGATTGVTVDLSITARQQTGHGNDALRNFENLEGTEFDDVLTGDNGANKIGALAGNDLIRGRGGDDDLTGGTGNDTFRFDAAGTANGVDRIRGFTLGSDKLEFHTADGYAANATLTFGTTAVGAGPQGIYDIDSGKLYYDADGDGAGAAIQIAQFDRGLALTGGDFVIVNDTPSV